MFITNGDKRVKLQLFKDKTYNAEHALRRVQTFDTILPFAPDPYWLLYDREILARRVAQRSMSLSMFVMFFVHMENRWLELMRMAVEERVGDEETVVGFTRFCDSFDERFSRSLARYTDLDTHEYDYAWLCLIYANQLQPTVFLTKDILT